MKLLSLHCEYIKFKPVKKALKQPEEISDKKKQGEEIRDCLVILTAVERQDEANSHLLQQYVEEISSIAKQVNAKNIVLYPYAHLSPSLSKPGFAQKTLEEAEKLLKKKFKVSRAPFGYYKEFELKCKGHPLSELSREITSKGEVREDEAEHKELLRKMSKVKMSTQKPPKGLKSNVELGRDLDLYIVSEIVGGGLPLFAPKGATIIRELKRFIEDEELKRGYSYTETPIMAKSDLYKVSGHWQHYKDSMFALEVGNETFALRPMTCPFQFILYKRKPRSYAELPLKYAEIATLFRNEQSGELRGLTRVRQFALADAHVICRSDQLEAEFEKVIDLVNFVMEKLGITETWYRFSKWKPKDKGKYINNPKA
jgi:threonyl-tRNA synthetase